MLVLLTRFTSLSLARAVMLITRAPVPTCVVLSTRLAVMVAPLPNVAWVQTGVLPEQNTPVLPV